MSDAPGYFLDGDGNIRSTGDPGGGYSCEVDRPARYVGVRAKNGALMHEATFYKDLAAIEKAGLLAGFATRCVRRGQLISSPGQADNLVFIVRSGRLRVCLASQERELTLAFLARGDVFSTHTPGLDHRHRARRGAGDGRHPPDHLDRTESTAKAGHRQPPGPQATAHQRHGAPASLVRGGLEKPTRNRPHPGGGSENDKKSTISGCSARKRIFGTVKFFEKRTIFQRQECLKIKHSCLQRHFKN